MFLRFADRPSDSPYIERVWRGRSDGGGPFVSVAAGHLELVVTRLPDFTMVTVRGPETRATTIECPPDGRVGGDPVPARRAHALAPDPPAARSPRRASAGVGRRIVRAPRISVATAGSGERGTLRRSTRPVRRHRTGTGGGGRDTRGHGQPLSIRSVQRHFRRTTGLTARVVPPDRTGASRDQPAARRCIDPGHRARGRLLRPGPPHPLVQGADRRDTGERHAARHKQLSFLYKTGRPAPG